MAYPSGWVMLPAAPHSELTFFGLQVPAYFLMAFSDELRARIDAETARNNQQANSRQPPANGLPAKSISISLTKTHHRVLAIFLAFTQGRLDLIELQTAPQYWQCYDFAHAYGAKHLKSFLVNSFWPKVEKEDPMGSFAFACINGNDDMMKACFVNMADHWCITVDVETGVAVWSSFDRKTYAVDTPARCADAFASKIGLDRFRAFITACDMALETASAQSKNANGDVGNQRHDQLRGRWEGDGEYFIFDGPGLWKMIYEQTMLYAEFSKPSASQMVYGADAYLACCADKLDGDVIAWIDDIQQAIPLTPSVPGCARKTPVQSAGSGDILRDEFGADEHERSDEERQSILEQEAARAQHSSAPASSNEDEEMAQRSFEVQQTYDEDEFLD